jgi:hypothetical protein
VTARKRRPWGTPTPVALSPGLGVTEPRSHAHAHVVMAHSHGHFPDLTIGTRTERMRSERLAI